MNREKIKISEIIVENRQRQDYGDLRDLESSLQRYGLIQPIVLTQDRRLIAGGRRLQAAINLTWTEVDVVYRETLTTDELHEMELEENVRRKEMLWTERCICIQTIHDLKKRRFALEGRSWGQRETGELFNIKSSSNVNYALRVAGLLKAEPKDEEIWSCENLSEAWRVVMRREEDRILASLARQSSAPANAIALALSRPASESESPDLIMAALENQDGPYRNVGAKDAASAFVPEPISADQEAPCPLCNGEANKGCVLCANTGYTWSDGRQRGRIPNPEYRSIIEQDQEEQQQHILVPLSKMLFFCDSIQLMLQNPSSFDHIITDIPYGIDIAMMNQQLTGLQDIDTITAEHDVTSNEELFRQFFPAAFHCLRPNSFLITFCDQMQWRYMFDLAESAGFKCQRWPLTWVKAHQCINQSANVNFTKTTEIALVCRKGIATLTRPNIPCHITAAHDEMKDNLGHPFVKPFDLWEHLISAVSLEGQTILEPFAGRGSGVISMLRLNRKVVACEINSAHYNALVENVKQHFLSLSPNCTFI